MEQKAERKTKRGQDEDWKQESPRGRPISGHRRDEERDLLTLQKMWS